MALLQDGLIAFFSAVGLTAVVWLAAGLVFHTGRPVIPGLLLVLPLREDAPALEVHNPVIGTAGQAGLAAHPDNPAVLYHHSLPIGVLRVRGKNLSVNK